MQSVIALAKSASYKKSGCACGKDSSKASTRPLSGSQAGQSTQRRAMDDQIGYAAHRLISLTCLTISWISTQLMIKKSAFQ
jgi:hypothetical protein